MKSVPLIDHFDASSGYSKVRHNMNDAKIPPGHELISLRLDPAPGMATRLSEWQAQTRAELEANGMVVTSVEVGMFHGYFNPAKVDLDSLLG